MAAGIRTVHSDWRRESAVARRGRRHPARDGYRIHGHAHASHARRAVTDGSAYGNEGIRQGSPEEWDRPGAFLFFIDIRCSSGGVDMSVISSRMDWDWVIKGDHVYDTRRERRSRLLRKRHMARVFRMLAAVTTVFCLVGVGTFAWIGVEQAGASRRAAQSAALADEGDRSAGKYARMVEQAHAYNRKLAATPQVIGETSTEDGVIDGDFGFKDDKEYQHLLDFGDGIMASVEIPSIGVDLPVRHGADSYALDNGLGHLHGTSLPVGGESTHSVITGHTGVADKALFTRLTELRKGDVFYVKVAAQTLAYKVMRIRKVDPDDLRSVRIQPGRDLVTLVTCTPIFLNTYRLLVTGERVSMPDDAPYPEDAPRTSGRDTRPYLVSGVTLLAGLPAAIVAARPRTRPFGRHGRRG
ncbi:class C sortase [Bifidobacterium pseudocatenulatum]|uniref:Class C sortase n=2 Tax=Bifidobacterium pseudocatenulatum TaxID=28026 RepID=A0A413KAQ2_BIFPS|nr:class C sortase [Bifidobacterium pseudocatenulatum]RGY39754.1 class C sortase [Bifidobacterium pseudocatenulatum]RGY40385.1 class C sortase [Bifidobacterium pseudocatenulatum]RGY44407.1 class C sortase [Bifidobacterium pseudocatenulatum]RGY61059.1 class C sortase [Bifidobacterium pseudocatenulatum]